MSFIMAKMMPRLIIKVIEMFALSEHLLLHLTLLKMSSLNTNTVLVVAGNCDENKHFVYSRENCFQRAKIGPYIWQNICRQSLARDKKLLVPCTNEKDHSGNKPRAKPLRSEIFDY